MFLKGYSEASFSSININLNSNYFKILRAYITLTPELYLEYESKITGEIVLENSDIVFEDNIRKGLNYILLPFLSRC